ncbi:MAG: MFS transporter [Rhodospirillales bacterium]|nr:MFS transporter [Rhodospirillales bacterium]MDP6883344.1 MFS transporter [Rhodospirillales bacterium]
MSRPFNNPVTLLRNHDFRGLWFAGGCFWTTRWIEILAVSVFVFDFTGSAAMVALMVFARTVPMVLFGAVVGALAQYVQGRTLLLFGLAALSVMSAVLGLLVASGAIEVWHIALGAFLSGTYGTMEFTVRRIMLGEIVGTERAGSALALDAVTMNGTKILGPVVGGILYELIGLEGAYAASALLHGAAVLLVAALRHRQGARTLPQIRFTAELFDGFRYAATNKLLIGMFIVTVTMNFFAFPFVSMVPVIGKEVLHLSALPIGLLITSNGLGSVVGALFISVYQPRNRVRVFFFGSLLNLVAIFAFSYSWSFEFALVTLLAAGLCNACFGANQSAIVFLSSEPAMRSRMMGALTMCIGMGQFGFLHLGVLAGLYGGATAVAMMTAEGFAAMAAIYLLVPALRKKPKDARVPP